MENVLRRDTFLELCNKCNISNVSLLSTGLCGSLVEKYFALKDIITPNGILNKLTNVTSLYSTLSKQDGFCPRVEQCTMQITR